MLYQTNSLGKFIELTKYKYNDRLFAIQTLQVPLSLNNEFYLPSLNLRQIDENIVNKIKNIVEAKIITSDDFYNSILQIA